jgi:PAS domain S-box-containing protein
MKDAKILVVEDESIVAKDIQNRLKNMGYQVPATSATGEDAILKVEEHRPDLVLMDIMLQGAMDGVMAAESIRKQFNIPVIYVTAYSDQNTLERAKISEPFGYLLKPFEERELHSTIEMALYKHKMEKRLKESEQWLATTLKSIGDAVIATDRNGRIAFMNPAAEQLTGWMRDKAMGQDLTEVFNIIDDKTRTHVDSPVVKILRERLPYKLPYNTSLIAKDGMEIPIDDSASPIADDKGNVIGAVLAFRDITERKMAERVLRQHAQYLIKRVKELNCLYDIVNVAERPEGTLEDMIERCLRVMPAAWQYPEETSVRIRIGEDHYVSDNFKETPWRQEAGIFAHKQQIGSVEVIFLREKPEKDEGPFLKEERSLINAVALEIGHLADRARSEVAIQQYRDELSGVVKEMNYAFTISEIIENPHASLDEIARQTLDVLPEALRYPERVCAKIVVEGRGFTTPNYEASPICYSAEITAEGQRAGMIEMAYLQEGGDAADFLKEEKALIDSVALQFGHVLEWKREEARWKETIAHLEQTRDELEKSVSH